MTDDLDRTNKENTDAAELERLIKEGLTKHQALNRLGRKDSEEK